MIIALTLLVAVDASGTVYMKNSMNQQITDTKNTVKQTGKDLALFEEELRRKHDEQGLSASGQKDLAKASAKTKSLIKSLQKRASQQAPPSMSEKESYQLIKIQHQLAQRKKAMLKNMARKRTY